MSKPLPDLFRQWHDLFNQNYVSMKHLYFCAYPHTFDKGCQLISLKGGEVLWKVVEQWMETNGYKHCYVYTTDYLFVWSFERPD